MNEVKVRYTGEKDFPFRHGNVSEDFTPGEVKEVSAQLGETLLKETIIVREWKDEKYVGQKSVQIFEEVLPEETEQSEQTNSENQTENSEETESENNEQAENDQQQTQAESSPEKPVTQNKRKSKEKI